jgi:hypothetical protein
MALPMYSEIGRGVGTRWHLADRKAFFSCLVGRRKYIGHRYGGVNPQSEIRNPQ